MENLTGEFTWVKKIAHVLMFDQIIGSFGFAVSVFFSNITHFSRLYDVSPHNPTLIFTDIAPSHHFTVMAHTETSHH
jgi:hypothetical protein